MFVAIQGNTLQEVHDDIRVELGRGEKGSGHVGKLKKYVKVELAKSEKIRETFLPSYM